MLAHATVDKLTALRLAAMAEGFQHQLGNPTFAELSFEDRLGLLVDAEWTHREPRKLRRRLQTANLRAARPHWRTSTGRVPGAASIARWSNRSGPVPGSPSIAISSSSAPRGSGIRGSGRPSPSAPAAPATPPTVGRAPRLFRELHVARGDGSYLRVLARLAKIDLVVIDDLGLAPLTSAERHDLLELLEDRTERASTLITSQVPVKGWHEVIGEPTLADAICDRLVHNAYVIKLDGPSMRDPSSRARGADPPESEAAPSVAPDPPPPTAPGPRKRP